MEPAKRVSVLIADDDSRMLEALAEVLAEAGDLELVGMAGSADEAVQLAQHHRPDIVVLDTRMPGGGGARAARQIQVRSPNSRIVALSAHRSREAVIAMLRAGAMSYVLKDASAAELVEALRGVARGEATLSPEAAAPIVDELVVHLEQREGESEERRRQLARLRAVMEAGGPRMALQPIFDLQSGEVLGAEALARFDQPPDRPPDVWFSEAAALGFGADLELAAVEAALDELPGLPGEASLWINVSAPTLRSRPFAEALERVPRERLVLEITEHCAVQSYDELRDALRPLREEGCRLAVDDAGAGYSSLKHIAELVPHFIKLDMSLCRLIAGDAGRFRFAQSLLTVGGGIGATVLAEGIETAEELDVLRGLGVRYGQGFHLMRPSRAPLEGLEEASARIGGERGSLQLG